MSKLDHDTLTKIIATLGPASSSPSMIEKLIRSGVDVFRINFSHGSQEDYDHLFDTVRKVSARLGRYTAIMGDLPGPKIRLGEVAEGGILLKKGQLVQFTGRKSSASLKDKLVNLTTNYPALLREIKPGEHLLIDDGNVRLICSDKQEEKKRIKVVARVLEGGLVTSRKGVNLPDTDLLLPSLTSRDRQLVNYAVAKGFDYLALSFVRTADDLKELKRLLRKLGARPVEPANRQGREQDRSILEGTHSGFIPIISKIEKPQAVKDLDPIIAETDAIMVARGDLGVEMDLAEVAVIQKKIISKCRENGIPVIVATQMLQSMIGQSTPTRAEVSDVANAIFDGTDAVMLSGETAMGKYPLEAVRVMDRIARKAAEYIREGKLEQTPPGKLKQMKYRASAIAGGAKTIASEMDVKIIGVWSQLGGSAVFLSQYRIPQPVIAFSNDPRTLRILSLLYGIKPVYMAKPASGQDFIRKADEIALKNRWASKGDAVIYIFREPINQPGHTNQMNIHYIGDDVG